MFNSSNNLPVVNDVPCYTDFEIALCIFVMTSYLIE